MNWGWGELKAYLRTYQTFGIVNVGTILLAACIMIICLNSCAEQKTDSIENEPKHDLLPNSYFDGPSLEYIHQEFDRRIKKGDEAEHEATSLSNALMSITDKDNESLDDLNKKYKRALFEAYSFYQGAYDELKRLPEEDEEKNGLYTKKVKHIVGKIISAQSLDNIPPLTDDQKCSASSFVMVCPHGARSSSECKNVSPKWHDGVTINVTAKGRLNEQDHHFMTKLETHLPFEIEVKSHNSKKWDNQDGIYIHFLERDKIAKRVVPETYALKLYNYFLELRGDVITEFQSNDIWNKFYLAPLHGYWLGPDIRFSNGRNYNQVRVYAQRKTLNVRMLSLFDESFKLKQVHCFITGDNENSNELAKKECLFRSLGFFESSSEGALIEQSDFFDNQSNDFLRYYYSNHLSVQRSVGLTESDAACLKSKYQIN